MTSLVSEGSTQCLSGSAYDWVDNFGDSFGLFLIQKKWKQIFLVTLKPFSQIVSKGYEGDNFIYTLMISIYISQLILNMGEERGE